MKTVALVLLAAASMGCTGESMDLLPRSSPLVGTWDGYVEGFTFESGSDRIQFEIVTHDEVTGAVTGTVTLGMGTASPPATDPDVGYLVDSMEVPRTGVDLLPEGATFELVDGLLEAQRFRVSFNNHSLWREWCELQTPRPDVDGSGYGCAPAGMYDCHQCETTGLCTVQHADAPSETIDCGKFTLCEAVRVCECTAEACTGTAPPDRMGSFDIALDGEIADGTVQGGGLGTHNVRLERLP